MMDEIQTKIISILSDEKKPLMIKTIAERCHLNPQTIARRLDTLELLGRVRKIQIGHAKKYFLIDTLQVSGLIDISSDLILILNTSHVIQYLNHSAEKFLGLENRQVIGEKLEFLNLDIFSSPEVLEGLKRFNTEKVFRTEITYTHTGSLRWYFVSVMAMTLGVNALSIAITVGDITEKKLMEEKIKESEAKYRLISENSSDVIWLLDVHSRMLLYISPSVYELLGYLSEELMNLRMGTILGPELSQMVLHNLPSRIQDLLSGNESARIRLNEIDLMHKCGILIPTEMVSTLLTDESGAVTRLLGVTRNITTRRLHEKALMKSQEHANIQADILEQSFQPIVVAYPDLSIEYHNPAFEKLTGYTQDELRNTYQTHQTKWTEWMGEDWEKIELLHNTGRAVRFEKEIVRKDKVRIQVEIMVHMIRNQDGDIIRYYWFVTDITQRKETEKKIQAYQTLLELMVEERTKDLQEEINARIMTKSRLRESEERFSQVADNAGEWIWETDNEGVYLYCSPVAYRICGYTPEELTGRKFYELYPPESREELLSIVRSVTGRKESFRQFQVMMVHKDGSFIRVETSGSPAYNDEGILTGYRGTHTDITEQTRMEKALLESRNYNRFLFEDSPVPLVLIDADTGTYLDFNTAALELYGNPSEELIGREIGILSQPPGSEPDDASEHLHRCLAEGNDSFITRYQKPDGGIWYGLVSVVRFGHGDNNRILVCFQEYQDKK